MVSRYAHRLSPGLLLALAMVLGIACSSDVQPPEALRFTGGIVFTSDIKTTNPRVRYADSLESVNDQCAVKKGKLNRKVVPYYVNGSPVGFC